MQLYLSTTDTSEVAGDVTIRNLMTMMRRTLLRISECLLSVLCGPTAVSYCDNLPAGILRVFGY